MLMINLIIIFLICYKQAVCENIICSINGKRSINTVDDRFISMSIDPAALITGININYTSLVLAQHLSPSFLRIAGPSTEFLSYSNDSESNNIDTGITVTASMWQSLNEWFKMANLTPVFAINDNEKVNGAWNPKPFYPLLDLSDKLNIICLWQLGFDSSCKILPQYKDDLLTLKHIVDTFPSKKNLWKVVGGDISGYVYNVTNARHIFHSLLGQIDHFMYENASLQADESFPDMSMRSRLFPKGRLKIWTTAPKSPHAITFSSAVQWARQIGDAARCGYNVVFRQPRLHEFFVDTPIFWVSLLHKHLMGRKVLDVKFPQEKHISLFAYAHCTRKQNDFSKVGAITIMAVNNETTSHVLALRIGSGNARKIMIHSYTLTTTNETSVNTYLNGKKLSMEMLQENEKLNFTPKLRRAHITKYLALPLPKKSVNFFVLPGARIPLCINEEYNMNLLMQEIYEDQNIKFENEENDENENYDISNLRQDIDEENNYKSATVNFNEVYKQIEDELMNDENYYKNYQYEMDHTTMIPVTPLIKDYKREIKQKRRAKPNKLFTLDLNIDNQEIKEFIKEKLKERVIQRDKTVTSEEIDEEAGKIAKKVTNAIIKRTPKRYVAETVTPLRDTRDINMELVRVKADRFRPHHLSHSHRNEENINSMQLPRLTNRGSEKSSTHRHSSLFHSRSELPLSPKHHLRSSSRTHNFRHPSLHRPHRLKEKRNSNEGTQDTLEMVDDTSLMSDFERGSIKNKELWEAAGFDFPVEDEESIEDALDYSVPNEHSLLDYGDEDYYEIEIYPDDPFMRRKRNVQQDNNIMQDKYHYVLGKVVDPSKIYINPRQKEHQLKLLRQRLSRRKKIEDIQRKIKPAVDTSTPEPKVIINIKRPFSRNKRSALELSLKARYKKYTPRQQNLKQWRVSDEIKLEQGPTQYKRSIDSSENEITNEITDSIEAIGLASEDSRFFSTTTLLQSTTDNGLATSTEASEPENNCMTNEECLNLILGSSLDPEEFLKPGWASKMYKKVVNFLAKLQKDVLQVITN